MLKIFKINCLKSSNKFSPLFKFQQKQTFSFKKNLLKPMKTKFKLFSNSTPMNLTDKMSQNSHLLYNTKFCEFSTGKDDFQNFMDNYEKNLKQSDELSSKLMSELKILNEKGIISIMQEMNKLPIRYPHLEEVKAEIITNILNLPFTSIHSVTTFLQFVDKLEIENFEASLQKIERKIRDLIKSSTLEPEEISLITYAYSKYQIVDTEIWKIFYNLLLPMTNDLKLENLSQILLAFTMVQSLTTSKDFMAANPNAKNLQLLSSSEYELFYDQVFQGIEKQISNLTFLDTFRICISMTKRPVPIIKVSEQVWKKLQENFKKEINAFDLYQISQIILLFCETPYLDSEIFQAVESELVKEYLDLDKLDTVIKAGQFNPVGLIEDLSKISFGFALSRNGSQHFWSLTLKIFIKLKDNMSNLALENLLFVSYRLIDYLAHLQSLKGLDQPDESMNNLVGLFKSLEELIIERKLIENNQIDPFNAMMPFARFGNVNSNIWNPLVKNLMNSLNKQSKINPFLANDVIFALSNYYLSLIMARDSGDSATEKDVATSYYLTSLDSIWGKIEQLIISLDESSLEIPHLANMVIDLSQIDLELTKAWTFLSEIITHRFKTAKDSVDINNFIMILMGFSKRDVKNEKLWLLFEEFIRTHIDKFALSDLTKIIMAFLKHKEISREFWKMLELRIVSSDIIAKINLEFFYDLQIPMAITGMYHEKIWNKFEEIIFRNLKVFETDKDYLMNSVYSFSRSGRGSNLLWSKLTSIIAKDLNGYDIDDLGHLAICLKFEYIQKNKLETILDEKFWNSFARNVESKMDSAKLTSLSNLLKGITENQILKKNEKLIKIIEKKIELSYAEFAKKNY